MEISGQHEGDSVESLTLWSAAEALAALPDDDTVDAGESDTAEPAQPEKATETEPEEGEDEEPEATDDDADEADRDDVEESDDDEQQETPSTPAPQKLKAKVNGQEVEITPEEAVAGYQRQQDYSRKTQELAELRKKFEQEELTPVRAQRQQLHAALTQVEQYLTAVTQEPDWDSLKQDPNTFAQVHAAWQVHQDRMGKLRQERETLERQLLADQQEQRKQFVTSEREKLLAALPEWSNPETAKKDVADLFEYATSQGVTPAEMSQIDDHRTLLVLRKAMLYDRAEAAKAEAAKKAKPKIDKVRTVAPAAPAPKGKPRVNELKRRQQRLVKTGSVRDAAAALELMPDDE